MRILLLSLALAAAAFADDALEKRYPELDAADLADAKAILALEDHVNGWFDETISEKRAAHIKAIEGAKVPFAVIEAIVRHGRRYERPKETIVGNLTLPPKYDPARPTPVLVGLNGLADGWEREASIRGYITLYPWKVEAWQDPRTTDIILDQLWTLSRRVNIDFDRLYCTGYSVGGHATWIAGATRTDAWAALLPVSGSPGRILVAMSEAYLANMHDLPCRTTVGVQDTDIAAMAKKGQGIARRFGIPSELDVLDDRGHESFDDRAEMLLAWSCELKRARYPAKIDYRGGADLGSRHYWVEVTREDLDTKELQVEAVRRTIVRHIPVTPFHVQATVKGQEVSVFAKHVQDLRVSLSDAMLDLDKEITIKINGKIAWKGLPDKTVRTLLDSSERRQDRLRTFSWEHEFDCR